MSRAAGCAGLACAGGLPRAHGRRLGPLNSPPQRRLLSKPPSGLICMLQFRRCMFSAGTSLSFKKSISPFSFRPLGSEQAISGVDPRAIKFSAAREPEWDVKVEYSPFDEQAASEVAPPPRCSGGRDRARRRRQCVGTQLRCARSWMPRRCACIHLQPDSILRLYLVLIFSFFMADPVFSNSRL